MPTLDATTIAKQNSEITFDLTTYEEFVQRVVREYENARDHEDCADDCCLAVLGNLFYRSVKLPSWVVAIALKHVATTLTCLKADLATKREIDAFQFICFTYSVLCGARPLIVDDGEDKDALDDAQDMWSETDDLYTQTRWVEGRTCRLATS